MNQVGASIRSSPRRVLTFVYRGKIAPCNISMSSPNMNMRPYIGLESGNQLVPEPSRLIGSARSMVECMDISICIFSCSYSPAAPWVVAATEDRCSCAWLGRLGSRNGCEATAGLSIAPTFDVERWTPARDLSELDVPRFFSFSGTSFIPHFGQLPG